MHSFKNSILAMLLVFTTCLVIAGCGGGGSSPGPVSLSGTASHGNAFADGSVITLADSKGVSKTTTVGGGNGAYQFADVSKLTAPFVLNANDNSGNNYFSYVANTTNPVVNINPLTNLCVATALGATPTSSNIISLPANFATNFTTVYNNVLTAMSGLYPSAIATTQDFLNGNISIGTGVDKVLDSTTITTDNSGNATVTIAGQQILATTGSTGNSAASVTPNTANITTAQSIVFPDVTVSGQVTLNGTGLAGATVTLSGSGAVNATTDNNGNYTFSYVSAGSYTVSVASAGYSFAPPSQAITVATSNATQNFTAAISTTISGRVTYNGAGLRNVTVTLSGGSSSPTATTDTNGNYAFTGVANGRYTVSAALSGYVLSSNQSVTVANSVSVGSVNFTATMAPYSISGQVTSSGNALPNVTVTLTGGNSSPTTTTDKNGNYSFNVTDGSYTISAASSGYTLSSSLSATVNNASVTSENFTATPITPQITSISQTSGNVGSSVTITGTNFGATASANAVSFNGTAATITSASATQLVVTVPTGATSGPITVTRTDNNQTATSASFAVTQPKTQYSKAVVTFSISGTTTTVGSISATLNYSITDGSTPVGTAGGSNFATATSGVPALFAISGSNPKAGEIIVQGYSANGSAGASPGAFAATTFSIAAGSYPTTSDFTVTYDPLSDLNGNTISGASVTISVAFQ